MSLWIVIYLITLLLFLLEYRIKFSKGLHRFIRACYSLFLIFVVGFRYKIGTDYDNYVRIIEEKLWKIENIQQESFYIELYKFIDNFNLDSQMFFLITTILMFYFLNKFLNLFSPYFYLSYLIFFIDQKFFMNVWSNGVRQAIAISIFVYSLKYIVYENKLLKGLILIILASFFHITALSTIPIIFLRKIKIRKFFWLTIPIIPIVFDIFLEYIIKVLGGRYLMYLKSDFVPKGIKIVVIFLILSFLLVNVFERMLNRIFIDKKITEEEYRINKELLNFFQIGVFIYVALTPISTNFARFSDYYIILIIILIPTYKRYSILDDKKVVKIFTNMYVVMYIFIALTYQIKNLIHNKSETSINNFNYKLNIKIFKNDNR